MPPPMQPDLRSKRKYDKMAMENMYGGAQYTPATSSTPCAENDDAMDYGFDAPDDMVVEEIIDKVHMIVSQANKEKEGM